MVRLSKIYTKTGDGGTTMLGSGETVAKHDLRVEAYGTVDEANAFVGLAVAHLPRGLEEEVGETLRGLQHDLFDCGADLCVPREEGEEAGAKLRIERGQVEALERLCDRYNEGLPALNSFVLPGGTASAAYLHVARTVVRRAERLVSGLHEADPGATNALAMVYLNRLSDLLFVLARRVNVVGEEGGGDGPGDTLWQPGKNRPGGV